MNIVIACAGSKAGNAGYMKTEDRICVKFVGDPDLAKEASPKPGFCYARPDGDAKGGKTWRDKLIAYNESCAEENPFRLLPAYKLYTHPVYRELSDTFCLKNVYILSAGWGLIRASFLTPKYNITFSEGKKIKVFQQRNYTCDNYSDFNHLQEDSHLMNISDDTVVFFGTDSSKNGVKNGYLPLFCDLTKAYSGPRIAYYYHSKDKLKDKNVEFVSYN